MTELEKVEKLREKANVSFSEAKEALAAANGDILDALIYLERQGKATVPAGGGFFSGVGAPAPVMQRQSEGENKGGGKTDSGGKPGGSGNPSGGDSFGELLKKFGKFCLMLVRKGNSNFLDATKGGEKMFSCPVTFVVLFLLFFFWVTIPLFIVSLFFGFRYSFSGADLGRQSVNNVMDSASDLAEEVKRSFRESGHNESENDKSDNVDSDNNKSDNVEGDNVESDNGKSDNDGTGSNDSENSES